jgi:type II secretory pathway pseudopilin PulG
MTPAAKRATQHRGAPRPRRYAGAAPAGRGLTMLEVVFAVLLLGLVATSISSLLSLASRLHTDNIQRLGAYEVANRLILMHLDDRNSPPSDSAPISQGNYRYRFSIKEEPVKMKVKQTAATARSQGQVPMDRFKRVTVTVWIVDDSSGGDNRYAAAGEQMAELTRIYDPFADLFRNPDSRDRLVNSPEGLQDLIRRFSTQGNQEQAPPPAGAGGGSGGGR